MAGTAFAAVVAAGVVFVAVGDFGAAVVATGAPSYPSGQKFSGLTWTAF